MSRPACAALLVALAAGAASCGGGDPKPVTAGQVRACLARAGGIKVRSRPLRGRPGLKGLEGVVDAGFPAGDTLVFVTASGDAADDVKAALSNDFNRYMVIRRGNAVLQVTGRLSEAEQKEIAACVPA